MERTRKILNGTMVVVGDIPDILAELAANFELGAVGVIYDKNVEGYATTLLKEIKRVCRAFEVKAPAARECDDFSPNLPEFVRCVLGIGAGSVAEYCKAEAKRLDVEWSLVLSAPSTDGILCGYAPKNVFICQNLLLKCPFDCVAAGYGILLSEPLNAFESFFKRKVLAFEAGDGITFGEPSDNVDLALKLLEASACREDEDSAALMARLMYAMAKKAGKRPRLIGEYKFLASSLISAFYGAFLKAPSYDVMPPATLSSALDALAFLGIKDTIPPKKVDFFDINAYFKISYILSEYRLDLLEKLGSVDRHTGQRFWRRLYPDAGYWLKREVNENDLLRAMALAGAFSDGLLGYAFASGVTARF